MITVNGKLNLTDVGAHERVYEGVKADVQVTFSKGKARLNHILFDVDTMKFFDSVGSTVDHWRELIHNEFYDDGDYLLDSIVENLPDDEYAKAEDYITAYYKDKPMPDGVEIPVQGLGEIVAEHMEKLNNE